MILSDFFENYFLPLRLLGLRPATIAEYRTVLNHWQRFRPTLPIAEIDALALAQFAARLLEVEHDGPATVNKCIWRHLLPILRCAAQLGLRGPAPQWRRLREEHRQPVAFLVDEFERLLVVASRQPGMIGSLPAGPWWESLLRSIWFSGARIGAMLSVRQTDISLAPAGFRVRSEQQKQRRDQWFPVDSATAASWLTIWEPQREIFWERDVTIQTLHRHFRRLIAVAGLDVRGAKRFHRIRCATASYLKARGGNPTEQLGHSGPAVTRAYYDPRITDTSSILQFLPALH